jgi:fatty acid desaturase
VRPARVEWPTVAVGAAIWGGFLVLLFVHDRVPAILLVVILGVLAAWYGSLQHEVIHGHPTPWGRVNVALVAAPLTLVVPFATYRDLHLAHHRTPALTHPALDPESYYASADDWARWGPVRRTGFSVLRTLAGRMVLGPFVAAGRCWADLVRDARTAHGVWRLAAHVTAAAAVMAVVIMAGVPPLLYIAGVAWGGGALTLLRSFAEHRWSAEGSRSAVVRSGPVISLLFLNNNLHFTHHERPGEPWYRLPAAHRAINGDAQAAAGAGLYASYVELARRYAFRSFDQCVIPSDGSRGVRRRSEAEAASSAGEAGNLLASRARGCSGDRAEDRDGPVEGGGEAAVGAQPGDLGLAGIS